MNDKVVCDISKQVIALTLESFSAFLAIVSALIMNTEPDYNKLDIFQKLTNDHVNGMSRVKDTLMANTPADLSLNGCIAILLDISAVVEIDKTTGYVLELDIETEYLQVRNAIDIALEIVMLEA